MLKAVIKDNTIGKRIVEINNRLHGGTKRLFKGLSVDMRKDIIDNFEKERDPDGKKWKALKPDTLATPPKKRKRKTEAVTVLKNNQKKRRKILHNSGRLKKSIKSENTLYSASVTTSSEYAMAHQYGSRHTIKARNKKTLKFYTVNGWRYPKSVIVNIPARPFIGISKRRYKRYCKQIMDFIYKGNI